VNAGASIIRLERLRELWIHCGTACNLSCPFCHEGSRPGDSRLEAPTLAEILPVLREATLLGVERFAFTGGEPLILKGIGDILLQALQLRPVLVLTNGTAPFIRRSHQLALLRDAPHALSLRVSIDFPDEKRHDAGRGLKNFRKALEGLRLLREAGFAVGITRQMQPGEDGAAVHAAFRNLLRRQRLPEDLPVVALPELGLPVTASEPAVQSTVMDQGPGTTLACSRSRMLLKRAGEMRFNACPLTDDAPRFESGSSLTESVAASVVTDHPRCSGCRHPGVEYWQCP
jgi:pyruvate-formate lyase-activating enzyme